MTEIRAIVFDSNVFGFHALPKIDIIRNWAQACMKHDAALWIPEIVALELAQHATEEAARFRQQIVSHNRIRCTWGVDPIVVPDEVTVDDIISQIEEAGAELVLLEGDEAKEAIVDQVLLLGAGERKKGTKTGAADSAWVRSIISVNGGNGDGLLVVTADERALSGTCGVLGIEAPQVFKHIGELHSLLEDDGSVSDCLRQQFEEWLNESVFNDDGIVDESLLDLGRWNWWDNRQGPDFVYEWEFQQHFVRRGSGPDSELIEDLKHDRWAGALAGAVSMRFDVEEQYTRQDCRGNEIECLTLTYPGRLKAHVTVFLDDDGSIRNPGSFDDVELIDPDDHEVDR